ncbi:AbrB family transcriptional regulator [Alkalibacterium iburiense]|uniref:AbrB family transcriptional regulator n=1 Tax=Alkalibacterium iburiense TaxID=290589 RepID=A0ABN0X4H8_9LACT
MRTIKTRKQGNAITVTVPKSLNVEAGEEYIVIKGDGGAFTYIPKEKNIFHEAYERGVDLRVEDEIEEDYPLGRELL